MVILIDIGNLDIIMLYLLLRHVRQNSPIIVVYAPALLWGKLGCTRREAYDESD